MCIYIYDYIYKHSLHFHFDALQTKFVKRLKRGLRGMDPIFWYSNQKREKSIQLPATPRKKDTLSCPLGVPPHRETTPSPRHRRIHSKSLQNT